MQPVCPKPASIDTMFSKGSRQEHVQCKNATVRYGVCMKGAESTGVLRNRSWTNKTKQLDPKPRNNNESGTKFDRICAVTYFVRVPER